MEKPSGERIQDQVMSTVGQVGARITDFLAGNPLETDVGKMIVAATNADVNKAEDWGLIMQICDTIIESSTGGRDALRAIRRQLNENANKNPQTIMYTLTVLEACVKNCGGVFAAMICKQEFLEELIKLIKKETPPAVQEKVLSLIQSWADAFRGAPECADVVICYEDLKKRGIEFPPTDLDAMAPIITPKRTVFNEPQRPEGTPRASQPGMYIAAGHQQPLVDEASVAKIQGELSLARKHAEGFLNLLKDLPASNLAGKELIDTLQQVYATTKEMRDRTALLVQQLYDNPALTTEILDVNDILSNAVNLYDNYINPPKPETRDPSMPGPSSSSSSTRAPDQTVYDQTDAGLNVAAFNKTDPVSDRVAQELEDWILEGKKEVKQEEKKDDGL
uniref:Uncharacterized protein n=1 Tax=Panagrolaimus sp. ES5 TaxID=591445 RepID=A0AC34FGT7_9BILA